MGIGNAVTNFFIKSSVKWRLTNAHEPDEYVEGQFQPESFTRNVASVWAEQQLPRRQPVVQWVGEALHTISFRAYFWNEPMQVLSVTAIAQAALAGNQLSVEQKIRRLIKFAQYDKRYGGPPVLRFTWGDGDLRGDVVIESLGGIQYEELRSDGSLKGVSCELALKVDPPKVSVFPEDPTAPVHKSLHKPMVDGESYESLAQNEYGNPLYGILLRQEALIAFPKTGDVVDLPAASYFVGKRRQPVSQMLGNDSDTQVALVEAYDDRAATYATPLVVTT